MSVDKKEIEQYLSDVKKAIVEGRYRIEIGVVIVWQRSEELNFA